MTRRIRRGDDTGASLVIALLFVTVVATVVAVLLSLVDTNVRTTLNIHDQAARTADADGAAQVAINELRKWTFDGTTGHCFSDGTDTKLVPLPQPSGPADSAFVTCETDTVNTHADAALAINSGNKPGNAILTLGSSASEDGLKLTTSASGDVLRVHGGIFSNSNINIVKGTLNTNTYAIARTGCPPALTGKVVSTPAPVCPFSAADTRGNDPLYPLPNAPAPPRSVPACTGNGDVIPFSPGLYDSGDINDLNALTRSSGCKNAIFWFQPGTYYFDFPENKPWTIDTGYVVGGKASTAFQDGVAPTIPGACKPPIPPADGSPWVNPGPNAGVQIVLGGTSQINLSHGQFEICGTYSASTPPLAVYGMRASGGPVPIQSGCTTQITPASGRCPSIASDNSPNSKFFIQGTTYVPKGWLDVALNNSTGQVFRYGVVARALSLNPTGSANLSGPVIEVPDDQVSGGLRTVLYLSVYVCPGTSSCSATGAPKLKVKVGLIDSGGTPVAGQREVVVYTWSAPH